VKCNEYHHLPPAMRQWYPDGCSSIILGIDQDKFSHLTKDQILKSLASCVKIKNYNLIGEAFSDNQRNFWPNVIEDTLSKRIGLSKIWQKLSRDASLQTFVGATEPATVERQLRDKLNNIIQRRNDVIHRGRSYFTPSETEVRDGSNFMKILIYSMASTMKHYFNSI
jgi:hypothetical protein